MWPGVQNVINNLLLEILLRVVLLAVVCVCQLKAQPHMRYISEAELLNEYRRPRHDSYVPAWATVFFIVFVPLLFICTPCILTRNYVDITQALLGWTLALTINAVITESVKLIVGRPRPDFFYRCFPNGKIMPGLRCTGNAYDVMDGRKSFPSGHSSFSFCSLGFLSFWLCGKLGTLSRNRGQSSGILICLAPLMIAGIVALSRCCDNHHHWQDVLAGALLGFTTSYFCYNQYYQPLDSEWSGDPYAVNIDHEFFNTCIETECCTKDLKDVCLMLHLCSKRTLEGNKKIS